MDSLDIAGEQDGEIVEDNEEEEDIRDIMKEKKVFRDKDIAQTAQLGLGEVEECGVLVEVLVEVRPQLGDSLLDRLDLLPLLLRQVEAVPSPVLDRLLNVPEKETLKSSSRSAFLTY